MRFMHVCCTAGKQATDLLTYRLSLEVDTEFGQILQKHSGQGD